MVGRFQDSGARYHVRADAIRCPRVRPRHDDGRADAPATVDEATVASVRRRYAVDRLARIADPLADELAWIVEHGLKRVTDIR